MNALIGLKYFVRCINAFICINWSKILCVLLESSWKTLKVSDQRFSTVSMIYFNKLANGIEVLGDKVHKLRIETNRNFNAEILNIVIF